MIAPFRTPPIVPKCKDDSPRKPGGRGRAGLLTANWQNSISPLQTHRIPCEVSPLSRTRPPLLYRSSRGKVRSKVTSGKKITKPSRTRLPSPSFRQCFLLLQHFQAASCTRHTPPSSFIGLSPLDRDCIVFRSSVVGWIVNASNPSICGCHMTIDMRMNRNFSGFIQNRNSIQICIRDRAKYNCATTAADRLHRTVKKLVSTMAKAVTEGRMTRIG